MMSFSPLAVGWTNSIAILWLAMVVFPWVGCGVVGSPAACVATVGKGAAGEAVGGLDVDGGRHHCAVAGLACRAVSLPDFNV